MSSGAKDIIVDDEDTAMVSFSRRAWMVSHDANLYRSFHDQSYHYTYSAGASVVFSFNGSYVAYYADLNSDHGAFLASVDDAPGLLGTSYAHAWSGTPRLLFHAHLPPGPHTLTITNAANPSTRLAVGVDFFVYRVAGAVSGAPSSTARNIYTGEGAEPPKYSADIPPPPLMVPAIAAAASVLPATYATGATQRQGAVTSLIGLAYILFACLFATLLMLAKARRQIRRMKAQLANPPLTESESSPDLNPPPYYASSSSSKSPII